MTGLSPVAAYCLDEAAAAFLAELRAPDKDEENYQL
jgi:hypothetical protein